MGFAVGITNIISLGLFPTLKTLQRLELCFLLEPSVPPVPVSHCNCRSLAALVGAHNETAVCHMCFKIHSASVFNCSDSFILPTNANGSLKYYLNPL